MVSRYSLTCSYACSVPRECGLFSIVFLFSLFLRYRSKKKSKKKSHKYSLSPVSFILCLVLIPGDVAIMLSILCQLVDVETPLLSTVDKGCKETPGEPVEVGLCVCIVCKLERVWVCECVLGHRGII